MLRRRTISELHGFCRSSNMYRVSASTPRSLQHSVSRRNEESNPQGSQEKDADGPEISDMEWEIRAGRALSIIKETLPAFFQTGLVEYASANEDAPSIYSSRIQLSYTPPPPNVPLPLPQTLHIEGLPLYHASSVFVRHSLSMFYTDLRVELRSCRSLPSDTKGAGKPQPMLKQEGDTNRRGERKFTIGFGVLGSSRMGGGVKEWDILSTYHISPVSGQIYKHVVESIQPAPHSSIYAYLATAFGRLAGFKPPTPEPAVPGIGVRTSPIHDPPGVPRSSS